MMLVQQTMWFFFPAMLTNLVLYLFSRGFGTTSILPMDLRLEVGTKRLLGDGRGLTSPILALLVGVVCASWQERGVQAVELAVGAQFGMVANSWLKRRLGLPSGREVRPLDNVDFILGASLMVCLSQGLSLELFACGLLVCGTLHRCLGPVIKGFFE